MKVNRILETCLYVDNLLLAEEFYGRVLGLVPFAKVKNRHVFFQCGQQMLLLFNPAETVKATGEVPTHGAIGPGHVAFSVLPEEIALWRAHLRQENVVIESEVTWPAGGQSIYFRDPAGNSLEVATPQVWQ